QVIERLQALPGRHDPPAGSVTELDRKGTAMTWSIVAHDAATGAFGVAVTTCAFAVGARCPFVRAAVGAVATQASVNTMLGPMVLDLLEQGRAPAEAISEALRADHNSAIRQVHAVDAQGRAAAWTGGMCVTWCGHETHEHF